MAVMSIRGNVMKKFLENIMNNLKKIKKLILLKVKYLKHLKKWIIILHQILMIPVMMSFLLIKIISKIN